MSQVPPPVVDPKLGPVVRVSEWNIDEGKNFDAINKTLGDCTGHMISDVKAKPKQKLAQWEKTYDEACKIGESDILDSRRSRRRHVPLTISQRNSGAARRTTATTTLSRRNSSKSITRSWIPRRIITTVAIQKLRAPKAR